MMVEHSSFVQIDNGSLTYFCLFRVCTNGLDKDERLPTLRTPNGYLQRWSKGILCYSMAEYKRVFIVFPFAKKAWTRINYSQNKRQTGLGSMGLWASTWIYCYSITLLIVVCLVQRDATPDALLDNSLGHDAINAMRGLKRGKHYSTK